MRGLSLIASIIFLALVALVAASAIRLPTPVLANTEPPLWLYTGGPLPSGAYCDFWPAYEQDKFCQWNDYFLTYDYQTHRITRASLFLYSRNITIGDLVTLWGTPTGYESGHVIITVYWPDRYVYVIARPFCPGSVVAVIVWTHGIVPPEKWKGFINSGNH